jgi:hypothetical protein
MLLARKGVDVSEETLVARTSLDEGGLTPEELALLARNFNLAGKEQIVSHADLVKLVKDGHFPIVYLYRKFLDGPEHIHAVIPIKFSKHFATMLDPLRGRRRVSIRKFVKGRSWVQNWAVVFDEDERGKQHRATGKQPAP